MDKSSLENLLANWKMTYPNHPLTSDSLKNSQAFMGAVLQIFNSLEIDNEAVLAPPPEEYRSESMIYYWDLLPVINLTRVTNYFTAAIQEIYGTISIIHFLQPTVRSSYSILVVLFNWMLFKKDRLSAIAPLEDTVFAKNNQVKILEEEKNKLLEQLNEKAEEKGKRSERLEKLDNNIKQYEEELKQGNEIHEETKQALDALLKENQQRDMLIEQKKIQRDSIKAEIARKKALRVYDAEDIKAQAEVATQNVQEAEEKLNSLRAVLMEKENCLKMLQTIKPSLDTANNLLQEITELSENLKELECGDLESESKEGELETLKMEEAELRAQLAELSAAREQAELNAKMAADARDTERQHALSALAEAEKNAEKCEEQYKKESVQTEQLKELVSKYEQEKTAALKELEDIKETFCKKLRSSEDAILNKAREVEKKVEEKLRHR